MTAHSLRVLSTLLEQPDVPLFGLEIVRATDLKSGTVYPILSRFENAGWLESRWEADAPTSLGRPRRRLYRLTGAGEVHARQAIEEHLRALRGLERQARARPKLRTA